MITIVIANHKGSVGKAATADALGAGLVALGRRVLLIDIDAHLRTNLSSHWAAQRRLKRTLASDKFIALELIALFPIDRVKCRAECEERLLGINALIDNV